MEKTIYLAGGCFWGTERYFGCLKGVTGTEVGYANGKTANPTYEDVKHRGSGHAETVRVSYDDGILSLDELLERYFAVIDPTSVNRQGADVGVQYRTGIYYTDEESRQTAAKALAELERSIGKPVAVELCPLEHFYPAEEYHQKYLEKNPGGYCHIGQAKFDEARAYQPKGGKG